MFLLRLSKKLWIMSKGTESGPHPLFMDVSMCRTPKRDFKEQIHIQEWHEKRYFLSASEQQQ